MRAHGVEHGRAADETERFGIAERADWTPRQSDLERSRLLKAAGTWGLSTVNEVHELALADPETFWAWAAEDLGLVFDPPPDAVISDEDGYEFPRWFDGGGINVVTSCVTRWAEGPDSGRVAVVYEGDSGDVRSLTRAELAAEVDRIAYGMRDLGVSSGDRVVLFMPVLPDAAAVYMACAKIGAVVVPAFSGYGPEALATRLKASGARLVVTADGTTRRGRTVPMKATVDEALVMASSEATVLVARCSGVEVQMRPGRDHWLADLPIPTERVATYPTKSNDPFVIVYTSGTTGVPKGIVLTHAGFLLKAAIDFGYVLDVQGTDVVAWTTDLGWMLGPLLLLGGLHMGATVVLIEGVPDHPDGNRFWRLVERHAVTVLGIAPTAARLLRSREDGLPDGADLSTLRAFASTGEAWDEPTWRWLFEQVGDKQLPILNYSGGTEAGGGILACYTVLPQIAGGFSGPCLGMDVDVWSESGPASAGAVGELVIKNRWPGMTQGFWNDRERYLDTYWSRWPHVWLHGDLVHRDERGHWVIDGRSDDTLKVSGRRVGPAEIEAGLMTHPSVIEVGVIGVPDAIRGSRIVAFVVVRPDVALSENSLKDAVTQAIGRSLVPAQVHVVRGLPKTKNGKILRRAIRARYLDQSQGDLSVLDSATPLELIPLQGNATPWLVRSDIAATAVDNL